MKRVVVWGWHSPSGLSVIKRLQERQQIEVIAWVGKAQECTHDLNEFLHQFGLGDHGYSGAAAPYYDQIYPCLPRFLELFSRVSFSMGRSFQEMLHIFNGYCDYIAAMYRDNRVDAVLFNNIPHFGVDTLLYEIAQAMGIKTVLTYQSLVPNRFFYVDRVEDFGLFTDPLPSTELPFQSIEPGFRKPLFYMRNASQKREYCLLSLFNNLLRMVVLKKNKPMTLAGALHKYQVCREYGRYASGMQQHAPDLAANFVYFPLQLQPELTTAALGGMYADQLLAIEHLSEMLPDDWKIYVKENPKQTRRQRDALFFQRLARVKKAQYIPATYDTYALLEHSRFVSAVTGTVGWEAISGGKNSLVFGKAWYRTLPGVFQYQDKPSLQEILAYRIEHHELEALYNELMAKTVEGVMDPVYQAIVPDYDESRNVDCLETFLRQALGLR